MKELTNTGMVNYITTNTYGTIEHMKKYIMLSLIYGEQNTYGQVLIDVTLIFL